jgi:acetamidase/formamidase
MCYPAAVEGALVSVGDPHASQGDSELCGTAIESSLNGTFQIILHKKADLVGPALEALDHPMLETRDEWLVHGFSFANYLTELGDKAQSEIYSNRRLTLPCATRRSACLSIPAAVPAAGIALIAAATSAPSA